MSALHLALAARAQRAADYFAVRAAAPTVPASAVLHYIRDDHGLTLQQFVCRHEWSSGFDDSDHETRIYCLLCGQDGDA